MLDTKEQAIILLPVYKPTEQLLHLCETLSGFTIVCVDRGSDSTYDALLRRVATHATVLHTHGDQADALRYGYRHIGETADFNNRSVIVTADESTLPSDILRVAEEAVKTGGVVAGVRPNASLGQRLNALAFRVASGKGVSDITTGLFAAPRERALSYAALPGKRWAFEVNRLFAETEDKPPITEVTTERRAKDTGFHPVFHTIRLYWAMFLASRSLKYLFSSGVAFLIDYALLLLLARLFTFNGAVELVAAPGAWVISSLTNFFLNRNFVFRSDTPLLVALPEYYGLAAVVFLLKTYVLLELMVRGFGVPLEVAKLVAEVIFFISNYFIQKKFIFKEKKH